MLFKRRNKLQIKQKIGNFFVPIKGLRRSFIYIWRRIWRINATPYAIAFGVAAGVFASCTPFLGFHFIIAAAIAFLFKSNLLASALGTAVGNPISFPFIWYTIYRIGNTILGTEILPREQIHFGRKLFHSGYGEMWGIFKPMIIGGIPLGLLVGAISYFIVYRAVSIYQKARYDKFNS